MKRMWQELVFSSSDLLFISEGNVFTWLGTERERNLAGENQKPQQTKPETKPLTLVLDYRNENAKA